MKRYMSLAGAMMLGTVVAHEDNARKVKRSAMVPVPLKNSMAVGSTFNTPTVNQSMRKYVEAQAVQGRNASPSHSAVSFYSPENQDFSVRNRYNDVRNRPATVTSDPDFDYQPDNSVKERQMDQTSLAGYSDLVHSVENQNNYYGASETSNVDGALTSECTSDVTSEQAGSKETTFRGTSQGTSEGTSDKHTPSEDGTSNPEAFKYDR
jgi:hypothetical protein